MNNFFPSQKNFIIVIVCSLLVLFSSNTQAQTTTAQQALASISELHNNLHVSQPLNPEKATENNVKQFKTAYDHTIAFILDEIDHAINQVNAGIQPYHVSLSADMYHTFISNPNVSRSDLAFLHLSLALTYKHSSDFTNDHMMRAVILHIGDELLDQAIMPKSISKDEIDDYVVFYNAMSERMH
ncbi:MAG: hypothetical protein R3A45_07735 [Bdellovibrionota bacterium]